MLVRDEGEKVEKRGEKEGLRLSLPMIFSFCLLVHLCGHTTFRDMSVSPQSNPAVTVCVHELTVSGKQKYLQMI